MSTLDQRRAANALDCVRMLTGDELRKSYRSYAERLGPAIVMTGLGQALATERAAAGSDPPDRQKPEQRAHAALFANASQWLCRADGGIYPGADDLLAELMAGDQSRYLRAQVEALAWLSWHKKFCQAELPRRAIATDGDG
jgi:CRISPR-associated protein Cmr5